MNQYEFAIKIVNSAFRDKVDKAGNPYVNHLYRVANRFDEGQELRRVIALLHDILEDCPEWNEKSLRVFFDDRIVDAVVALTHTKGQPYSSYIEQVMENHLAKEIKKYDLEDNMNICRLPKITDEDIARLKKYHAAYLTLTTSA